MFTTIIIQTFISMIIVTSRDRWRDIACAFVLFHSVVFILINMGWFYVWFSLVLNTNNLWKPSISVIIIKTNANPKTNKNKIMTVNFRCSLNDLQTTKITECFKLRAHTMMKT